MRAFISGMIALGLLATAPMATAYTPESIDRPNQSPSLLQGGTLTSPSDGHNHHHPDANDTELGFPEEDNIGSAQEPELLPLNVIELDEDTAKRAIDALDAVYQDYGDRGLDEYETLEEFVAQTEAGKQLEKDLREFKFRNISAWDSAITSLSITFQDLLDHGSHGIHEQIQHIRDNRGLDEETRDILIANLEALIPSSNNRKVLQKLMKNDTYKEKLERLLSLE